MTHYKSFYPHAIINVRCTGFNKLYTTTNVCMYHVQCVGACIYSACVRVCVCVCEDVCIAFVYAGEGV